MEELNNARSNNPARPAPEALHERAEKNLQTIRELMENSSSFTGVSGIGYMLAGLTAFLATWIAAAQDNSMTWLLVWMAELMVAGVLAFGFTARKSYRQGQSLWSTNGKKVLFAFLPPMAVGAVLTVSMTRHDNIEILPGIWLCVYGAAVMTAGAYSVAVLPFMGALFLFTGTGVLFINQPGAGMLATGNLWLGTAMGGLHLIFGYLIWKDYGG